VVSSAPLRWLLTTALAAATVAILSGPHQAGVRARVCNLAHAILCTSMIAMVWSSGLSLPGWLRTTVLGGITAWFLAHALSVGRAPALSLGRLVRWRGLASLHHAVTAGAMTWMSIDTAGSAGAGHAGGGHMAMLGTGAHPAAALAGLGGYFLVAALPWISMAAGPPRALPVLGAAHRRRGLHAAGNAAMSIGMGMLLIAHP
jgi:hypothetical protein